MGRVAKREVLRWLQQAQARPRRGMWLHMLSLSYLSSHRTIGKQERAADAASMHDSTDIITTLSPTEGATQVPVRRRLHDSRGNFKGRACLSNSQSQSPCRGRRLRHRGAMQRNGRKGKTHVGRCVARMHRGPSSRASPLHLSHGLGRRRHGSTLRGFSRFGTKPKAHSRQLRPAAGASSSA